MCTSLAPGFYLRDKESFQNWRQQLLRIKNHFKDESIFSVFEKTPAYMKEDSNKIDLLEEDEFQLIDTDFVPKAEENKGS